MILLSDFFSLTEMSDYFSLTEMSTSHTKFIIYVTGSNLPCYPIKDVNSMVYCYLKKISTFEREETLSKYFRLPYQ